MNYKRHGQPFTLQKPFARTTVIKLNLKFQAIKGMRWTNELRKNAIQKPGH